MPVKTIWQMPHIHSWVWGQVIWNLNPTLHKYIIQGTICQSSASMCEDNRVQVRASPVSVSVDAQTLMIYRHVHRMSLRELPIYWTIVQLITCVMDYCPTVSSSISNTERAQHYRSGTSSSTVLSKFSSVGNPHKKMCIMSGLRVIKHVLPNK